MNAFDLEATLSLDTSQYESALLAARKAGQQLGQGAGGVTAATEKMAGGFTVLKGVAANLVSGGINMLAGAITQNLGGAISRVDILENYKKVMGGLGYATDEADAAINKMSDGIQGLPTTLPAIATLQQQFAALSGNIGEATDIALALNDATLAGGQGQEIANSAMNQWYQIIANGKPDLQSWRIINMAMPAQLKQISQELLGDAASAEDLRAAWMDGTVATEDVTKAIIKLDKEGGKGIKKFSEQSRDATGGIQTQMTNLRIAIQIGLSNIIKEIGVSNISKVFDVVKSGIKAGFAGIVDFMKEVKDVGFAEAVQNLIANARTGVLNGFFKLFSIDWNKVFTDGMAKAKEAFAIAITTMISFDNLKTDLFVKMMEFAGELVIGLVDAIVNNGPYLITAGADMISNLIEGMRDNSVKMVDGAVRVINKFIDYLNNNSDKVAKSAVRMVLALGRGIARNAPKLISSALRLAGAIITGALKILPKLPAVAFKMVAALVKALWAKRSQFLNVGKQIVEGIGKGITAGTEWIKGRIRAFVGNVKDFLKKLFGINSPSKWAADVIGRGIDEGMAKGIKDNTGIIDSAMKDLLPDVKLPNISGGNGALRVLNINAPITVNNPDNPVSFAEALVNTFEMEARTV